MMSVWLFSQFKKVFFKKLKKFKSDVRENLTTALACPGVPCLALGLVLDSLPQVMVPNL